MVEYPAYGRHTLRIAIRITMLALLLAGGAGATTLTVTASGGADQQEIFAPDVRCLDDKYNYHN